MSHAKLQLLPAMIWMLGTNSIVGWLLITEWHHEIIGSVWTVVVWAFGLWVMLTV